VLLMAKIADVFPRRPLCMLLGGLCGLLLISCGDGERADRRAGGEASSRTPVTATVQQLWSDIRSGSPALTAAYDPELVRLLGTDLMLTVFDTAPPEYSSPPRLKEVRKSGSSVVVFTEGKGPGQKGSVPVSFLLAKVKGRWLVRYDSNLLNRIRAEVAAETQRRLPRTKAGQATAAAAGNRAVLDARSLFAQGPRKGKLRRKRSRAPARASTTPIPAPTTTPTPTPRP